MARGLERSGRIVTSAALIVVVVAGSFAFADIVLIKALGRLLGPGWVVNAKLLEGGYPELTRMIHGHPTFSEAILEAARAADGWLIHG